MYDDDDDVENSNSQNRDDDNGLFRLALTHTIDIKLSFNKVDEANVVKN